MSLGLCMTVKNESGQIQQCLDNIVDLFDQIEVIDTGSTDQTIEILQSAYGIAVQHGELKAERCFTLSDLRNYGYWKIFTD